IKPPSKPLREVALAAVARSELTATQLRQKLRRRGYELIEINKLIEEFQQKNYLNDARAAVLLVNRRAKGSKWGAGRIKQELAQKGVAKDLGTETLAGLEEQGHDWLSTATALLKAKYKAPLPPEPKARQQEVARRLGFLQRRGFSGAQAAAALKASTAVALDDWVE
ncbi:MAG: regulatory protein RecX, partial [Alphaproteobacteria bacterium]|nr:regulatory protein RecX [Alphaproteobacteria bacterium]